MIVPIEEVVVEVVVVIVVVAVVVVIVIIDVVLLRFLIPHFSFAVPRWPHKRDRGCRGAPRPPCTLHGRRNRHPPRESATRPLPSFRNSPRHHTSSRLFHRLVICSFLAASLQRRRFGSTSPHLHRESSGFWEVMGHFCKISFFYFVMWLYSIHPAWLFFNVWNYGNSVSALQLQYTY